MPEPAVATKNLWVTYNGLTVLEDITLEIEAGRFVGILGPNGAGKSTFLKVILGLVRPSRGQVWVLGESPQRLRRRGQALGYLPQKPLVDPHFPVSVLDVVLMGRYGRIGLGRRPHPEDIQAARRHLEMVGIPHLAERPIGEISGGEQQRVFIARALCMEPRLLILDEPMISLDACAQDDLYEMVYELKDKLNLTVLMVSHDIGGVARHVNDIVCLNRRVHVHQPPPIGRIPLESTFGCSVEYLFHGQIPHRVVDIHDD
jgi:zinc transport system ATP-binding protein